MPRFPCVLLSLVVTASIFGGHSHPTQAKAPSTAPAVIIQSAKVEQRQPNSEATVRLSSSSRATGGIVLRVTVDKHPDQTGAVWCDVVVDNTGRNVELLPIHMYPQFYWLSISVKDQSGRKLSYAGIKYKVKDEKATFPLAPGRMWGRRFNLREYFIMDKKGTYSIAFRYGEPPDESLQRIGPLDAPPMEVLIEEPEHGRGSRGFLEVD
jgi:hypothetical protein